MQSIKIDKKSLAHNPAGQFEDTRFEKIHNVIVNDSNHGSILVAQEIALLIRKKKKRKRNLVF